MRVGLALKFISKKAELDRRDRELNVEQPRRPLYMLDETTVAAFSHSSVETSVFLLSRGSTVKNDSFYSFQFNEMARPAGLEPAAFCFEGSYYKTLSAASGVAYEEARHLSRP